jgi:hypothetical protein
MDFGLQSKPALCLTAHRTEDANVLLYYSHNIIHLSLYLSPLRLIKFSLFLASCAIYSIVYRYFSFKSYIKYLALYMYVNIHLNYIMYRYNRK